MLASKSENAEIAVLQSQMDDVSKVLDELKVDVKSIVEKLDNKYVTKAEFVNFKNSYWIRMSASAVLGAILTALVVFFFTHVKLSQQQNGNSTTTTTTTTTPSGSTPSAQATSTATSTPDNPKATDSQSSGGGITIPLPKL